MFQANLPRMKNVGGFPTIKFFGSQGGPGEEFSGARWTGQ